MGRWSRAWKALFDGDAPKAAGGLLTGVLQSGQAPRRGTRELLQAYKRLPWVHSAVHRISHDVAAVPLELYRPARRGLAKSIAGRFKGVSGPLRRKLMDESRVSGELVEVEQHPFLDLMCSMNPALGGMRSRVVTQIYQELKGECFWVYERNGLSQPVEAWPVPPHWMLDIPTANSPNYRASYSGWNRLFPEADVLWLKQPDPENPYARGTGLGESVGDELDIDELSAKYIKDWFFNAGIPPFILGLKDASAEEVARFKEKMIQEHRGAGKAHQVHVTNAEISVSPLDNTFKEQELTQLRQQARDLIIQVWNIPPEVMGIIENSNRATIDASYFLYATGVLCPRLDFLVDSLQPLADEWDESLICDYVSPVPEDREFRRNVMVALPTNYTIDEHRELAGLPPLPDGLGDELYEPAPSLALGPGMGMDAPPSGGKPPPEDPSAEPDGGADEEEEGEPPVKALPAGVRKTFDERGVSTVLEHLRPDRLVDQVEPVWESRVKKWGERALREVGVSGSFNMRNPLIRDHLEQFAGNKIAGLVNDATREELRTTLMEGAAAGEGIRELQQRVSDVFGFADKVRSRRIARTEVVGSSNFANLEAYKQSGVVASKEWLSVRDGSTRDVHLALDGQKVALGDPFVSVTGDSAQHPGGFGDPALDINCRCSVLPVVDDEKAQGPEQHKALTEEEKAAVWKRYDRRLAPWENEATRALRRGFAEQEDDILAALDAWG